MKKLSFILFILFWSEAIPKLTLGGEFLLLQLSCNKLQMSQNQMLFLKELRYIIVFTVPDITSVCLVAIDKKGMCALALFSFKYVQFILTLAEADAVNRQSGDGQGEQGFPTTSLTILLCLAKLFLSLVLDQSFSCLFFF